MSQGNSTTVHTLLFKRHNDVRMTHGIKFFCYINKDYSRGQCSFFIFQIKSCNKFRFSAQPDDLCLGLMGQAFVSLTVKILENNLKMVDSMVIGHQLLI